MLAGLFAFKFPSLIISVQPPLRQHRFDILTLKTVVDEFNQVMVVW